MQNEAVEELVDRIGKPRAVARAMRELQLRRERQLQAGPGGLLRFIRYFWHHVEPARVFVSGWALEAMCLHLEAVDQKRIVRLLITVPPGSMKSLLCSVFFPLWQWSARGKPHMRYMNFAYGAHLTQRDNQRMLQIIKSDEFQELWGHVFTLTADGKEKPANNKTGWKFATSVGGVGTGERGDGVILDDPHNLKDDKSEVVRPEVVRWFKEAMSNRLNDMDDSFIIAIMQRSHEADVAGAIIDDDLDYVHLNIPMEFEADNRCVTATDDGAFLWQDPRINEGELMWPERFSDKAIRKIKKLGEHAWVSQYQQRPEPRGGAIFKRDYWKPYVCKRDARGKELWPDSEELIIASLDGSFTDKEENDPNGFSIWSVFQNDEGSYCALLKHAWRKHLTFNGTARTKKRTESWKDYRDDTQHEWGLMQWVRYECTRYKVDSLLVEAKANGLDIINEMHRLQKYDRWATIPINPGKLDKRARALRVVPVFEEGLVYALANEAPGGKHDWKPAAKLVIGEAASFPRGRFKDITDTLTQVIWYLRKGGFLEHHDVAIERQYREQQRAGKKVKGKKALYPA